MANDHVGNVSSHPYARPEDRGATRVRLRGTAVNPGDDHHEGEGEAMTQLDRTVWTAPVRNLVWVAAHFGHR